MSYLGKTRADRVRARQDWWVCYFLAVLGSVTFTICSLILAYRPDALSVATAPAVVGMIFVASAFTKFELEASVWWRSRYIRLTASVGGMVIASGSVIAIVDRAAISKVADSLLLAL